MKYTITSIQQNVTNPNLVTTTTNYILDDLTVVTAFVIDHNSPTSYYAIVRDVENQFATTRTAAQVNATNQTAIAALATASFINSTKTI
jgi:hypothetical protein